MLVLPSLAAAYGPHFLLRLVGALGLSWLVVWRLTLRRWGAQTLTPGACMTRHGARSPASCLDGFKCACACLCLPTGLIP